MIANLNGGVAMLNSMVTQWVSAGAIPEVEWNRMKQFDFQEALRTRDNLAKRFAGQDHQCPNFEAHVRFFLFLQLTPKCRPTLPRILRDESYQSQ